MLTRISRSSRRRASASPGTDGAVAMPSFHTVKRVPHSPAQMFDLVADVEKYPQFVPLCESLRVRRRSQSDDGIEILVADMSVGYKSIRETFTTRVTLDRARLRIDVEYIDRPFRFLGNPEKFLEEARMVAMWISTSPYGSPQFCARGLLYGLRCFRAGIPSNLHPLLSKTRAREVYG